MRRHPAKITRDAMIFTTGLGGIIYQIVSTGTEKPTLIIACLGMMGLPVFLRSDESRRRTKEPANEVASTDEDE